MSRFLSSFLAWGLFALTLCGFTAEATARPSNDTIRRAATAVVRVTSSGCPGENGARAGSGFVWANAVQVVTALHVVADCDSVVVEYVDAGIQRRATPLKVLRDADLALLKVEDPHPVQALTGTATAGEGEELVAIGLPLNVRGWQETHGSRGLNAQVLGDILNDLARRQIERLGAPSVDLDIFRLTAVVKPGSSGGPVINAQGAVVGVVDGGLDGGNASLNWAVPADYLHRLESSAEAPANIGLGAEAAVAFSFSGEEPAAADGGYAVNQEFRCGGRSYFHLATRTLDDIVGSVQNPGTVDDPNGFLYLVNAYSFVLPPQVLGQIRFDLLVDGETGATIAVPQDMYLDNVGGFCVAASPYGDVSLVFAGEVFDPLRDNLQFVSQRFDFAVGQFLGVGGCSPDMALMEPAPHTRFDGLIARRSGAYCFDGFTGAQEYGIVGYLGRENAFAGIVAHNGDLMLTGPGGDPAITRAWAAAALAVMISTYQI